MTNLIQHIVKTIMLVAALSAGSLALAQDRATQGDPARWYQPDNTPALRYRTLVKEAGAALKESLQACAAQDRRARSECQNAARAEYQRDMADAKRKSTTNE